MNRFLIVASDYHQNGFETVRVQLMMSQRIFRVRFTCQLEKKGNTIGYSSIQSIG